MITDKLQTANPELLTARIFEKRFNFGESAGVGLFCFRRAFGCRVAFMWTNKSEALLANLWLR